MPDDLPDINADRLRIELILENLLSNAIKDGLGSEILVAVIKREKEIVVSVQDNGPGLTAEQRSRLFQADETDAGG